MTIKYSHPKTLLSAALCASAILCSHASLAARFQAEDYTAFADTSAGNTGGAYRSDDVDIEATSDEGGGYNVGWVETGEWLTYASLNIPANGRYVVRARVASGTGGAMSVDLNAGSILLGKP